MPYTNPTKSIGALYELGRSAGYATLNTGSTIQSQIVDCRDIAAIGFQDFPGSNFLPPSQVWLVGYSFVVQNIVGAVADGRQLYVYLVTIFNRGGGLLSVYPGVPVYLPPVQARIVHGQWRVESDAARVIFNNNTGANMTVEYSVWAKAI